MRFCSETRFLEVVEHACGDGNKEVCLSVRFFVTAFHSELHKLYKVHAKFAHCLSSITVEEVITQPPFYGHYTGQPALAGTSS